MRASSAVVTLASVTAGRMRYRHCSPVGMKKNVQLSGPMPDVRRRAHSGKSHLLGCTANRYWSTKPSTNTGMADMPAVTMVVNRSLHE